MTFELMWPAIYAPKIVAGTASGQDLVLFVVMMIGASSLVCYGLDIARGGHHFSVQQNVGRGIVM